MSSLESVIDVIANGLILS